MPRSKFKPRSIGVTPPELMKKAVNEVYEKKTSVHSVSESYSIPFTTLWRYVKKFSSSENQMMLFLNQSIIAEKCFPMRKKLC